MKRKLISMLLALAMMLALAPMALAADEGSIVKTGASDAKRQAFAALSASNFRDYDTPLPTGGTKLATIDELWQIRDEIWANASSDYNPVANVNYSAGLSISKNQSGAITYAEKYENWAKGGITENDYYASLDESLILTGIDTGKTNVSLWSQDDKYQYSYQWAKDSNTGTFYRFDISDLGEGMWVPEGSSFYSDITVYADQTVLGEACFVYSYVFTMEQPGEVYVRNEYIWLSRVTGNEIKRIHSSGDSSSVNISFINEGVILPLSNFNFPANVTFIDAVTGQPADLPTQPGNDTGEVAAFVYRLYSNVLERTPDADGMNAWVERLASREWGGGEAAESFFFGAPYYEFKNRGLNDEQYLTVLYNTFMDRDPDELGWNAWTERMNNGMTWEEVFNGFVVSVEWGERCDAAGIRR